MQSRFRLSAKVRCNSGREQFGIDGYRALYTPVDSGRWSGVITYAKIPAYPDSRVSALSLPERIHTPELSNDGHCQVFRCKDFALVNAYVPFNNPKLADAEQCRKNLGYAIPRIHKKSYHRRLRL